MGVGVDPLTLTRRTLIGLFGLALAGTAVACRGELGGLVTLVRRALRGLPGLLLAALALPTAARGNELGVAVPATQGGIVIHDAEEVHRDLCATDATGRTWLTLPGGTRFELVTSTQDPVIANPGDGAFHPFDVGEVRAALAAVRYPLDGLAADVYLLPFPRRDGLASAAGPGIVLLSPGVYPVPPEQEHAEFVHELGHLVQYARMPDGDAADWDRYRGLRGIGDASVYWWGACHADRPHEIFAEDFRALFGDPLANYTGSIENPDLPMPGQVAGLAEFMRRLAGGPASVALAASPNPARGPLAFTRAGARAAALDVYDLAGRRLVTLEPQPWGGAVRWSWDGRDAAGRRLGPAVVFARARDGGPALRVVLLP